MSSDNLKEKSCEEDRMVSKMKIKDHTCVHACYKDFGDNEGSEDLELSIISLLI